MTLEIVDTFRSFDHAGDFLCFRLDTPKRAREQRADIARTGVMEIAEPAYRIERRDGKLRAAHYPGHGVSEAEWVAIRAAINA